ncbi:MAG TPA: hypothetical protein VFJ50_09215, partial [Gemmatimonadales bacterium]|nr:hypothetical protein [Gemmatimonadales bacterium]
MYLTRYILHREGGMGTAIRVSPGRSATEREREGKAAFVAAIEAARELSGAPLAASLGVSYELAKAYANPERPNYPPADVLERAADVFDAMAKEHA